MSQTAPDTRPERKSTMPAVEVGQLVVWYPDQSTSGQPGLPALVVDKGDETVDLSVFVRDSHTVLVKSGVRHQSDPHTEQIINADVGVWGFTRRDVEIGAAFKEFYGRLQAQETLVKQLQERVGRLEKPK